MLNSKTKIFFLILPLFLLTLTGCSSGNSSQSSTSSPLTISAEPWWRVGNNWGWLEVKVNNYGMEPIDIYGEVRIQTEEGKWYVGSESRSSTTYTQETLNPDTTFTFRTLFDAPNGTRFVKIQIFQATDDGSDGILVEGPIDFTIGQEW
jgi:hypothetical protein